MYGSTLYTGSKTLIFGGAGIDVNPARDFQENDN
jgi:hypothetical protein